MPPHSKSLEEEGAMIIAFKLVEKGKFMEDGITEILMSPGKVSVDFNYADQMQFIDLLYIR
jgi:N-methylhydantoinase B/oxoprolinase/acetone carboxylase alpha subunit